MAVFSRYLFIIGYLLSLSMAQAGFAKSPPTLSAEAASQLHTEITTLYQHFAQTTTELTASSEAFCTAPTPETLQQLQALWKQSMTAWMQTASVRLAPIKQENHDLRVQFFPDKRGTLRRKIPGLLNSEIPLNAEQLAQHGVAAIGLPALEWLLFIPDAFKTFQEQPRRCEYVVAASQLLQQHAKEIITLWQHTEATTLDYATLLKGSLEWLELSLVVRLGAPMGKLKSGKQTIAKPHLAESWRSQYSLINLQAGLAGWQQVWLSSDATLANALRDAEHADLIADLVAQVTAILNAIQAMPEPLHTALQTKAVDTHPELQSLYFELDYLTSLVRERLATALDVQLGFNSLDGD